MADITQKAQMQSKAGTQGAQYTPPAAGKKPTAAYVLMLIGGIIIFLAAVAVLVGGLAAISYVNGLQNGTTTIGNTSLTLNATTRALISGSAGKIYAAGGVGLVTGVILIALALMVRGSSDLKKIRNLSIAAIVVSVISYFGGAGLMVGMALGIIGGVLGLLYKG